jgi:hypothetical protein
VFATETSPCEHDGEDDTQTNSMIQTAVMWDLPSQSKRRIASKIVTYAGCAKDNDEPEVALRRGKTTTKRSQRRECGQFPHRRVYPGGFHLALDVAPLGIVTQTASIQETQRKKK